jgi:hypothetical protein
MKLRFTILDLMWLSLNCVIVNLMGAAIASAQSAAEAKPKEQLTDYAEWAMFHSNPVTIPKDFAKTFGMHTSNDDLVFDMMGIRRDNGSQAATFIKRRASGHIDIVFVVVTSNNGSYYYLTSADGKLIKAFHLNPAPAGTSQIANDDAQKSFEKEKSFWLERQTKSSAEP